MEKITLQGKYMEDFEKVSGEPLDEQLPGMILAMLLAGQEVHDHDWDAYEFSTSDVNQDYPKLTVDCSCGVKFQVVY